MKKENIAIVMAHPDDWERLMGGTAWLLKDRYQLHVFIASRGERGIPPEGRTERPKGKSPIRLDTAEMREAECIKGCEMIGIAPVFLGHTDGDIYASQEACQGLADLLGPLEPVALFTHWALEKPDHSATHQMAVTALHLANLYWAAEVYMPLHECFRYVSPDVNVNISAVREQKLALMQCHSSQLDEKQIESHQEFNSVMGQMAWCESAEGFAVGKAIIDSRWDKKAGALLLDL